MHFRTVENTKHENFSETANDFETTLNGGKHAFGLIISRININKLINNYKTNIFIRKILDYFLAINNFMLLLK